MRKTILALGLIISSFTSTPAGAIDGLKYHGLIDGYYKKNQIAYLWQDRRGRPTQQTNILLKYLENSWQHGLNPSNYHLEDIQNYLASSRNIAPHFFDQMISDAYLKYARDMTSMRPNPEAIEQDSRYWRKPLPVDWLLQQLSVAQNFESFLMGLEPQGPLYRALKQELIVLAQAPQHNKPTLHLKHTNLLHPGQIHDEFVPMLRNYLGVPASDWNQNVYDDALVHAVLTYQRNNNLKADGIIGPKTLTLMNKTPAQKAQQIIANMERLRWMEPQKPEKYILVNIPAAKLWAIEQGHVIHEMPVIIGRKDRPTSSFVSKITGVRYNPTWTVPKTIKKEDYLPKLQSDPNALLSKGIEIKAKGENGWQVIDPSMIDWLAETDKSVERFMMVQQPGPSNPLGRIRVLMPNQYNIYLHDTSSPEYFRSSERTVSSGCVRVKEPKSISDFIMSADKRWDADFTQRMLALGEMKDVYTRQTIPVYLLYLSIWLNENGTLTYGPDIYEWDQNMINQLSVERKLPALKIL